MRESGVVDDCHVGQFASRLALEQTRTDAGTIVLALSPGVEGR
jgi:hypothetical protein